MVAADILTDEQIAQQVGIARKTLHNWRLLPDFAGRVEAIRAAIRANARITGIALVENRVAALNDRWERMKLVVRARGKRGAQLGEVEEASTGLMVRHVKEVRLIDETDLPEVAEEMEGQPHGGALRRRHKDPETRRRTEVVEYAVDTGLLKAFLEVEKQAAIENGQWQEKTEVTQRGAVTIRTITAVQPALPAPSSDVS
jgi:hypothetical protein